MPNAHLAWVPKAKLYDYVLNLSHDEGGPKARLWRAVFGIERDDWRYLRVQIVGNLGSAVVSAVSEGPFGPTFEVVYSIVGRNDRVGPVVTAWKLVGEIPHLVTAFPRV